LATPDEAKDEAHSFPMTVKSSRVEGNGPACIGTDRLEEETPLQARLPRQNRVTPFGELISTEQRGTLMGNRGCLHDADGIIRRAFTNRRWIVCVLDFKDRHRKIMSPGRWTELFFLDEATAFAAGHRPCAECQRERYRQYREAWIAHQTGRRVAQTPSAEEIDRSLHLDRMQAGHAKSTYRATIGLLPDGTMVADDAGQAYLVLHSTLVPWEAGGYGHPVQPSTDLEMRVLTPRATVGVLGAGYPVDVHESAFRASSDADRV